MLERLGSAQKICEQWLARGKVKLFLLRKISTLQLFAERNRTGKTAVQAWRLQDWAGDR